MKRLFFILIALAVPFAAFAQGTTTPQSREAQVLKQQLGLTDAQVSQVLDIQKKTLDQIHRDRVHIRLLQAQIDEDLLATPVDQGKVNDLVDQIARARADIQKSLIAARIQLQGIIGNDALAAYIRLLRTYTAPRFLRGGMPPDGAAMMPDSLAPLQIPKTLREREPSGYWFDFRDQLHPASPPGEGMAP